MKEGECYEVESSDDERGSFHLPSSHKLTWLKQAGDLGSAWSQGPFWPLISEHLHVVVGQMGVRSVFLCRFQQLERKSNLNDQDKVLAVLDDICLPLDGINREPSEEG